MFRNVYVPKGQPLTAADKARGLAVVGAASHGRVSLHCRTAWIVVDRLEVAGGIQPPSQHRTNGILLHSDELADDEVCVVNGVSTTTPARTAFDVGRRHRRTMAVIRLDALIQATSLKPTDVEVLIERHRGARGIVQLRQAVSLSDPGAESPQETRTGLVLTDAGLRPQRTQIEVFDSFGVFVARLDMGWDDWRVGVQYDGEQHWTDPRWRTRDIDQDAELQALRWRIVRVSADMLRYRPATIVAPTRAASRAAGAPV